MGGNRGEEGLSRALSDGWPRVEAEVLQLVVQAHPEFVEAGNVLAAGKLGKHLIRPLRLILQCPDILKEVVAEIPEQSDGRQRHVQLSLLRAELGRIFDALRVAAVGDGGQEVGEDELQALEGAPDEDVRVAGVDRAQHGQDERPTLVQ